MIVVRPARIMDADELAGRLRDADLQEIQATTGEEPLAVLRRGILCSESCYVMVDEQDCPLAVFGVVPDSNADKSGIIWLLGSNDLINHSFFFLRNCREWIEKLHQQYKVLWNFIDARNEVHIRWLRWCNFTFLRRVEEYGVEQRPFYEFARVRDGNL